MGAPAEGHRRSPRSAGRGHRKLGAADRGGARQPGGTDHDPALLEGVFRPACRYAGQAPSQAMLVSEIRQSLKANIGWQRSGTNPRLRILTLSLYRDKLLRREKAREGAWDSIRPLYRRSVRP